MNKLLQNCSVVIKLAATAAAAALPLLASTTALADGQMNAAAACVVRSGGTLEITQNGEILNAGTTTMNLICPIDRGPIGLFQQLFGTVIVNDNNFSQDVCVTAVAKDPLGSSVSFLSPVCSSGVNSSVGLVTSTSALGNFSFQYHFLRVSLPPIFSNTKSALLSFRGIEQ